MASAPAWIDFILERVESLGLLQKQLKEPDTPLVFWVNDEKGQKGTKVSRVFNGVQCQPHLRQFICGGL